MVVMVVMVVIVVMGCRRRRGGQGGGVEGESIDAEEMGVPVFVLAKDIGDSLGDSWSLVHQGKGRR